ncbi:hypothetical protein FRC06_011902 [Ceratobasidium sp. 370]|nr:hypothetical protein FRC06_011902 [Ceratobasidium sp. 370]
MTTTNSTTVYRTKGLQSSLSSMSKLSNHEASPNQRDAEAVERYRRQSNVLSAVISGLLDDSLFPLVSHPGKLPTPKDLWDELERIFRAKDSNQATMLLPELHRTSLSDSENPHAWIARVRELYVMLKDTKMARSEFAVCQLIVEGLPTSYRDVSLSLQKEPEANWTIAHFASVIRRHWTLTKRLDYRSGADTSSSVGAFPVSVKGAILRPPAVLFKANGQKDPGVVSVYGKVCRQCLAVGHEVGSQDCAWYNFRVAAGWQSAPSDKAKKREKGTAKQVNAAESQDNPSVSSASSSTSDHPASSPATPSSHSLAQVYPVLVEEGGVEVYTDFACSYPAIVDTPESISAAVAVDARADDSVWWCKVWIGERV